MKTLSFGAARRLTPALLFLSGATGLVYEVVWSRQLSNLVGSSGQAHAVVLASFMGGLAAGAFFFGARADRSTTPLRLYGLLEVFVGLYALAFPWLFELLSSLYLAVAGSLPESARAGPRMLIAALALLPPTVAMGGTVPALVRHAAGDLGAVRRELARLYAVNSLGAVLGTVVAGVWLVPALGLGRASAFAAALNLVLGAVAIVVGRAQGAPRPAVESPGGYSDQAIRVALVGSMLAGFTSLLYEVAWIRLLSIVLGASTYSFTFIVAAFILGIALGSAWLMRRREDGDLLRLFGWLQIGLLASVCLALPLYVRLPHVFWKAHHALHRTPEAWPFYLGLTFVLCCVVLIPATFFMGASFPAAARVATASAQSLGRQLGGVYLWNTAGTVLGAAAGGLLLLPWLGLEGCFAAGLGLNLVAAGLALGFAPSRSRGLRALWPLVPGVLCAGLYLGASWGWSRFVSTADAFRQRDEPFATFADYRRATDEAFEVLFQKDDPVGTVLVGRGRTQGELHLRINGKVDGSTGRDLETQLLSGHLGILLHARQVKTVLLIGSGTAATAGAVLAHPVERVDLVEISPAVIEAARLFAEHNRHALDDPRLHVHVDDAKTFLATAPVEYDLVISEPSNPWVSGVSGLFSRDFFRMVDRALAPGGMVVQWVHTYESSTEIVRLVVRTFRERFPYATTWLGPSDILFLGAREPYAVDFSQVEARLEEPRVKADLARVRADSVLLLLARQLQSNAGQAEFAGQGPINTDDHNLLEFRAPLAFFLGAARAEVKDERLSAAGFEQLEVARYLRDRPLTAPQAERVHHAYLWHSAGNEALVRGIAERWALLAPDSAAAATALGRIALFQGDTAVVDRAVRSLIEQGVRDPELVSVWVRLEARRMRLARAPWNDVPPASVPVLLEAEARHPGHPALERARRELCSYDSDVPCPGAL